MAKFMRLYERYVLPGPHNAHRLPGVADQRVVILWVSILTSKNVEGLPEMWICERNRRESVTGMINAWLSGGRNRFSHKMAWDREMAFQ